MADRKHVTVVCRSLAGTGSVAGVALRQAKELAKYCDVTLVSESLPALENESIRTEPVRPFDFSFLLRRFSHVPDEVLFARAAREAVHKVHQARPVDLVLCHSHSVATLAASPVKQLLAIPFALVSHADIFDRPPGTYDARLTWLYRKVTPSAYRRADLVVAMSPYTAALARRGQARKVTVVPGGIDGMEIGLAPGALRTARPSSRHLRLIYVGRLAIEKGVDVLIRALSLLREQGVACDLRIVGSGPQERDLRALVAKAKLSTYVSFAGSVPRHLLGPLYQTADVACVPSVSEPFGMVVLEAMASGVAVAASDTGGIASIVAHEVTGLLSAPHDAGALAANLARLSAARELVRTMGAAGSRRALDEFNWEQIGSQLATSLFECIEAPVPT